MVYKNKLLNFVNDTSGNIAIMAAVMIPILLITIGAAVTLSDTTNRKSKLQIHADAMSLAMAKKAHETSKTEAENYFANYIETQLDEEATCTYTLEMDPSTAIVNCSGEVTTFLGGLLNKKIVPYSVVSTASMNSESIFEVSFVFDVSDSMEGTELLELQSGLEIIADSELFTHKDSRLSLLPFANTVRLGQEFEKFVTPGSGYTASGGVYNGCFDRNATDPNVDLTLNPTFPLVRTALNSGRVVCPHESMTAIFHKKATDWDVKDFSTRLETSFGTGMSDGLVWAFRSLDPALRGVMSSESSYPLDSFRGSAKHIIMMTDGRPYDRPWTGPGGGEATRVISLDRLESVCADLPFSAKGISFHLINYNNNNLSSEHIEVFENCVSGEGEFYNVAAGELEALLDKITEHISGLRLTQ